MTNCQNNAFPKKRNVGIRNVEAVIFQQLPLPHLLLPLPPTKNEKTTVDNFLNFCGSVACLLHFIISIKQKPSFIAITLPTSLNLFVLNYSVLFFIDIRTRVECRTVLFNLLVIAKPLMYFRVCHGTPTNKTLEITKYLQENQIFRY